MLSMLGLKAKEAHESRHAPRASLKLGAAIGLVTLWLAWTVPALFALSRPVAISVDAPQLLAAIEGQLRWPVGQAVLVRQDVATCRCAAADETLLTSASDAGLAVISVSASVSPYPVAVFDAERQLVYAGNPQLEPGCTGNVQSAWSLIARLLEHPGSQAFFAPSCSC